MNNKLNGIHPAFLVKSRDFKPRNGVGVGPDGRVHFVMTRGRVSFYEFARLFRDGLRTKNALFLDGGTAPGIYAPELGEFLGVGADGPPALAEGWRQARLERLARGLQNLPVRWPELWETVLRDHYIRGLQRGWRDRSQNEFPPETAGPTSDA